VKLVYICSKYRGNVEENLKFAYLAGRYAIDKGCIPIIPHAYLTKCLNDNIPEEREKGIELGLKLIDKCDELWVCGNTISEGMQREIEYAQKNGTTIVYSKCWFEVKG